MSITARKNNDFGLTIVIPAYNEEQAIRDVVEDVRINLSTLNPEIIVVDDGSSDGTANIAKEQGATVIRHHRNRGYGASLKAGIRAARTDFILTMDADGQHKAQEALKLWEQAQSYDMVVGERTGRISSSSWRVPGKWLLGQMANFLSGCHIPDINSGLRLISRETVSRYMHLCPSGFSFSTTITLALLTRGYEVTYVPIQIEKRVGKSTVTVMTGLETFILIIRIIMLFGPLRIFIPVSIFITMIGIFWGIPYTIAGRGVSVGSMLAIVTGILLFGLGLLSDQISQMRLERYE